ncbi:MAG: toll/interleukin-1 receptor domain-containing protein, partial [Tannerella sp.]|nr:toll/interleukin-1 receptor domain-containing protein [Tannerella sp.]
MESGFEYYAFISYKREDEKWAKWLQNKLEHYRLPSVIRKEIPRLPKRIRPVFRDKTDLGAGLLTDSLRKELEKSQYLIVICSPQSAKSEWVGKEINAFVEMGRADRIIPFVVAGTPYSNDEQECFHPVIKAKIPDILGINVNEIGKQQAFVKVAAKLLDLRFDSVWDRYRRKQSKQRIIAVVVGLFLLIGLGYVWDYNRLKTEYYADYIDRWGLAEGVVPLSQSQVNKRYAHYRFESKQRKLRRVVYANSVGTPIDHEDTEYIDRTSIQEFTYTDDGRLQTTALKNAKGKAIVNYSWGGAKFDRVDLKQNNGESAATLISITAYIFSEKISDSKVEIKRFKLTRNEEGGIIRKEFKRHNGDDAVGACDADSIWGFEYCLDSLGRPVEIYYSGYDGQHLPAKTGVMGRKYDYDIYGNICRAEYVGKDNKSVLNQRFWSDKNGNIIEKAYFGMDGNPCLAENSGYAKWTRKYNKRGNQIEETYFGIDGNPCLNNDSVAIWTAKYDERGNQIEEAYFGIDGNPCLKYRVAKWTAKYDERGNQIEEAYFGIDGNPCLKYGDYAKWTAK